MVLSLTLFQLRVWGGGIYQPSNELTGGYDFYNACDELGIFAWSELIFSDSLYPVNDFFLETVDPRVRQNGKRINRHPSTVMGEGNDKVCDALGSYVQWLSTAVTVVVSHIYHPPAGDLAFPI